MTRLLRNDIILILCLILVVAAFGAAYFFFREEGSSVTVKVNGEVYGTYSLLEDTSVEIFSEHSEGGYNLLVIKDGKAYVEIASCPDGVCAKHKPISLERESIVCLPNKVEISVDKAEKSNAPDVII